MSQDDENPVSAVSPPPARSSQSSLQPYPSPPPGYLGAGPHPYPYPARPPVQVARYASPVAGKSPGLAALLAGLFGCLGMLYATVPGAFIVFGINILLLIAGVFTIGIAWLLWLFTWIGGMVWAYKAAEEHNKKLRPPPYPPTTPR